jgi:hypothetical protein
MNEFIAWHQSVSGGVVRSVGCETILDRSAFLRNYRPAMTQPSGDFVLAPIFGYARFL